MHHGVVHHSHSSLGVVGGGMRALLTDSIVFMGKKTVAFLWLGELSRQWPTKSEVNNIDVRKYNQGNI